MCFNYIEKMSEFHGIDIGKDISQNFLTLSVAILPFDEAKIRAKYPKEVADKLINSNTLIKEIEANNNEGFSIRIEHYHYITKNRHEATALVHIDKDAPEGITVIKELKDPNTTHKYTMKALNKEVAAKLKRFGIDVKFNQYMFQLFSNYFGMKEISKFCYINTVGTIPSYQYSYAAIDFIVEEYMKDPEKIIQTLKDKTRKSK